MQTMTRKELSLEERIIMALYRPAIESNYMKDILQQLVFWNGKVYAVSDHAFIEISNLGDFKPNGTFYDLRKGGWSDTGTFPIGEEKIQEILNTKTDGIVTTNKNLLLQFVNEFDEAIKSKSRFIIAQGLLKKEDLVVSFEIDENNKRYAEMDGITFMVADDSLIMNKDIIPHQPYRCEIRSEVAGAGYLLNVTNTFGMVDCSLYYTKGSFLSVKPETFEKIMAEIAGNDRHINAEIIKHAPEVQEVLTEKCYETPWNYKFTGFIPQNNFVVSPTCVDSRIFVDTVRAFSITDARGIAMGLNNDPNKPITLESIGEGVKVRATIATLNPFAGPQRR